MLHFSGEVHLIPANTPLEKPLSKAPHWNGSFTLQAEDIYKLYFHGPAFQVLAGVQKNGELVLGKLNKQIPPLMESDKKLVSVPILVELCLQTAGVWDIGKDGSLSLPQSIGSLRLFENNRLCGRRPSRRDASTSATADTSSPSASSRQSARACSRNPTVSTSTPCRSGRRAPILVDELAVLDARGLVDDREVEGVTTSGVVVLPFAVHNRAGAGVLDLRWLLLEHQRGGVRQPLAVQVFVDVPDFPEHRPPGGARPAVVDLRELLMHAQPVNTMMVEKPGDGRCEADCLADLPALVDHDVPEDDFARRGEVLEVDPRSDRCFLVGEQPHPNGLDARPACVVAEERGHDDVVVDPAERISGVAFRGRQLDLAFFGLGPADFSVSAGFPQGVVEDAGHEAAPAADESWGSGTREVCPPAGAYATVRPSWLIAYRSRVLTASRCVVSVWSVSFATGFSMRHCCATCAWLHCRSGSVARTSSTWQVVFPRPRRMSLTCPRVAWLLGSRRSRRGRIS